MFQHLSLSPLLQLLLSSEINYVRSEIKLNTAFTFSFPKRQHRLRCPLSSFTSCRSSNRDDEIDTNIGSSWGPADDWTSLTMQKQDQNTNDFLSFFQDPAGKAARSIELEAQEQQRDSHLDEDDFVLDAIHIIQNEIWDPDAPALYDTSETFDKHVNSINFEDELGREISLLVRCNEVPDNINIEEGRALPKLANEDKYNIQQLIVQKSVTSDERGTSQYEPTAFFSDAIFKMFRSSSRFSKGLRNKEQLVLTKEAVAKWMSRSLNEKIGKFDKRVTATIAKYGTGGAINLDQFMHLYMEAVTSDLITDTESWKRDAIMKRMKLVRSNFMSVWRDLENHGFFPPIVIERQKMQEKIDVDIDKMEKQTRTNTNNLMDECEILEWGDNEHSKPRTTSKSKSSHELVEMCTDNKTPKRLRDGDFIFIDEASCIGCNQCVAYAPTSFKMDPGGRARTYHQSNSPEVATAVSACPVSCMYRVSFPELIEMETGRDHGDGRTDHRHLQGRAHTPLHVSRRSSDMNHKSSWYHYLKQKCYMSKSCPQRGCYDCPNFNKPGDNPYFKKLHKAAEKVRATDIINSGEMDLWRKTADL